MAIFTGETVEDAIDRGLNRLNVKRENAHIHVVQKEKKGFLGFGKKRAKVEIELIQEETVRKADHLADRGQDSSNLGVPKAKSAMDATLELSQVVKAVRAAEKEKNGEISEEERNAIIEAAKKTVVENQAQSSDMQDVVQAVKTEVQTEAGTGEASAETTPAPENAETEENEKRVIGKISSYLTTITQEMGVAARVSAKSDGNLIVFNLNSDHDALLIGKHGKILQSLQVLAKAYANSILNTRMNIAVNVGDYHEKRKAYIVSLAHRAASRARDGETVYINDLQSNERKIVHTIIAQEKGVSSHSEGQEFNRYIVVSKEI